MQEEEMDMNEEAREPESLEEEAAKPKKVIPKVPKGKFKKPEKADLAGAKGKFAGPKEGPVKKPSVERLGKKPGMDKRILLAIAVVVVVLVLVYLVFAGGSALKTQPYYVIARGFLYDNVKAQQAFGTPMKDGTPTVTEGEDKGCKTIALENKISGPNASGTFKATLVFFKNDWQILTLEYAIEGGTVEKVVTKTFTGDRIKIESD
jgi:cell division protein FtsL